MVSGALPELAHDKRPRGSGASWRNWRPWAFVTLADNGSQASTYAKIPYKGQNKPESQKETNRADVSPGAAKARTLARTPGQVQAALRARASGVSKGRVTWTG